MKHEVGSQIIGRCWRCGVNVLEDSARAEEECSGLLRCPFCGGAPTLRMENLEDESSRLTFARFDFEAAPRIFFVTCESCHASAPLGVTEQRAIDAWNRRPGHE